MRLMLTALAFLLGLIPAAYPASTIDPTVPAAHSPMSSAPIRANFSAAANDINGIEGCWAGITAPPLPLTGQCWQDISLSTTAPTLRRWDGTTWVPEYVFDTVNHLLLLKQSATPTGGTQGAASLSDLFANILTPSDYTKFNSVNLGASSITPTGGTQGAESLSALFGGIINSGNYSALDLAVGGAASVVLPTSLPIFAGSLRLATSDQLHGINIYGWSGLTDGTISAAANNGSGLCRLTIGSSEFMHTGDTATVENISGATECNGSFTITVVDATHIDLTGTTFSTAYTNGGDVYVTATSSTSHNTNAFFGDCYWLPDDGGDVSCMYLRQTGGGNTLSLFNLGGQRPVGSTLYPGHGFALEAQSDKTTATGYFSNTNTSSQEVLFVYQESLATSNFTAVQIGKSNTSNNSALFGFLNTGGAGSGNNRAFLGLTNGPDLEVDGQGKIITPATSAPSVTSCGTTPSIAGHDNAWTITTGSGTVTACTVNFSSAWNATPTCVVTTSATGITPAITAISTNAVTLGFSATLTSGTVYGICLQ